MDSPDARIARLAATQNDIVTVEQARAAGLSDDAIGNRVKRGLMHRVHRGVLLVGSGTITPLGRVTAALFAIGGDAVASFTTAALLWRLLDRELALTHEIHVTVAGRRPRRRRDLAVHATQSLPPGEVRVHAGVRVTSPIRTILDLATLAAIDDDQLELAIAQGVRRRLFTPTALRRSAAARAEHPGVARVLRILDRGAKFTRSEAEREVLRIVRRAGVAEPDETNTRVLGHEVDAVWHGQRVVLEVDSYRFHGDRLAFERDHNLQADLEAAGYLVIRTTWTELTEQPERLIARLVTALAYREARRAA